MKTFIVPCVVADDRNVEVDADNPVEAREKVRAGKYKRLGKASNRGFLIVGKPKEKTS